MGRRHRAGDIQTAFALARDVGFACVNMDLIAGLPRDSFEGFCRSLEGVLAMGPENITVHTLALKKGSTLMERRDVIPDGDQVARMLDFSLKTLRGRLRPLLPVPAEVYVRLAGKRGLGQAGDGEPL